MKFSLQNWSNGIYVRPSLHTVITKSQQIFTWGKNMERFSTLFIYLNGRNPSAEIYSVQYEEA